MLTDCIIIKSDDPNFFYLSGIDDGFYSDSFLIIKNKKEKLIVTTSLYEKEIKKYNIPVISKNEIDRVLKNVRKIGLNYNNITKRDFDFFRKFGKTYNIGNELERMREVKNRDEIKKIRIACKLTSKIMNEVPNLIKTGIKERSAAAEIEMLIKEYGYPAFKTIVASGVNSSIPHHTPGEKKIKENEFVIIDFGCSYKKYCADMTRTFFVGKPNKNHIDVYNTVLESQMKVIPLLKSGTKINIITNTANDVLKKYQTLKHSLGHGIGLSVHELPNISENEGILKTGMTTTIEPAIYLNNFGVRIEDVFLIEKNKCKQLTKFEKELICI